ncbi:DgyrCDS9271 [Dimorphilus gyrociliatus]|uniref:DgyrCDS9271 n=1 Tax=Dimorphilus gyrociliatus TaxID=2664684 RepID=A0A7I8VZ58_9ANNE|nr:DgyrCDS9271 [Dimorphilus gyrociliatus]
MPRACAIRHCRSNWKKELTSSFPVPGFFTPLEFSRRAAWIKVLQEGSFVKSPTLGDHICSLHFQSGKPASPHDVDDTDWAPSIFVPPLTVKIMSKFFDRELILANTKAIMLRETPSGILFIRQNFRSYESAVSSTFGFPNVGKMRFFLRRLIRDISPVQFFNQTAYEQVLLSLTYVCHFITKGHIDGLSASPLPHLSQFWLCLIRRNLEVVLQILSTKKSSKIIERIHDICKTDVVVLVKEFKLLVSGKAVKMLIGVTLSDQICYISPLYSIKQSMEDAMNKYGLSLLIDYNGVVIGKAEGSKKLVYKKFDLPGGMFWGIPVKFENFKSLNEYIEKIFSSILERMNNIQKSMNVHNGGTIKTFNFAGISLYTYFLITEVNRILTQDDSETFYNLMENFNNKSRKRLTDVENKIAEHDHLIEVENANSMHFSSEAVVSDQGRVVDTLMNTDVTNNDISTEENLNTITVKLLYPPPTDSKQDNLVDSNSVPKIYCGNTEFMISEGQRNHTRSENSDPNSVKIIYSDPPINTCDSLLVSDSVPSKDSFSTKRSLTKSLGKVSKEKHIDNLNLRIIFLNSSVSPSNNLESSPLVTTLRNSAGVESYSQKDTNMTHTANGAEENSLGSGSNGTESHSQDSINIVTTGVTEENNSDSGSNSGSNSGSKSEGAESSCE